MRVLVLVLVGAALAVSVRLFMAAVTVREAELPEKLHVNEIRRKARIDTKSNADNFLNLFI